MGKYCNTPIPNTDILITYFIAWHENDINWDHFYHDWATKAKHMKNTKHCVCVECAKMQTLNLM